MIPLQEIAGVQYGICEPSDVGEMISLLGEVFSLYDPPAVAVGITAPEFEDFVQLFGVRAGAEQLTIVARSAGSHELIGALLTEDCASPPPAGTDQVSRKFDPIFDILGQLDATYREGKAAQPGEWLHLFLLGVARSAGGRGVAQRLVTTCMENGAPHGYRLAVTEATNSVSQHIFRKLGFVERVRRSYLDHHFEGTAPFAGIEGHAGPILMDRTIT